MAPAVVPMASAMSAPLIRGKLSVFVQHIGLGGHADQCSYRIKNIYKQECKDNYGKFQERHPVQAELTEDRSQAGDGDPVGEIRQQAVKAQVRVGYVKSGKLADHAKSPGDQDPPEDIALDVFYHQDSSDDHADDGQQDSDPGVAHGGGQSLCQGLVIALQGEQAHQGGAADDDLRVL